MASEFVPLEALLDAVQAAIQAAGARLDERRGPAGFALGDCTIGLSVELRGSGREIQARFPSYEEEEKPPPPEMLSRLTLTLRPTVRLTDGKG